MCELGEKLIETGYLPFIAAGITVDTDGVPKLRLAGDANIVRRLEEPHWLIVRSTLIAALDKMHSAPLDDLTRA